MGAARVSPWPWPHVWPSSRFLLFFLLSVFASLPSFCVYATLDSGVTDPLERWYADSISGSNYTAVSSWAGTIAGYNATAYSSSHLPRLYTGSSGLNGRNVIRFDGATQAFEVASGSNPFNGCRSFTLAVVCRPSSGYQSASYSNDLGSQWYSHAGVVDGNVEGKSSDNNWEVLGRKV